MTRIPRCRSAPKTVPMAAPRMPSEGLRKMGWMDDEQIAVLILAYFDQVVMG